MDVPALATLNRIESLLPSYVRSVALLRDGDLE